MRQLFNGTNGEESVQIYSNGREHFSDIANENALTCTREHAAAVRQLPNGTNGDDLYIIYV